MSDETELASVVERNIAALMDRRRHEQRRRPLGEAIADRVTAFTGSITFPLLHACFFVGWILLNTVVLPTKDRWDPPPFSTLALICSVEAIFLSTFVLISQNRMTISEKKHAELDLQVNLLAEHEVTRLLALTEAISRHLGVDASSAGGLDELKRDVAPEVVLDAIEQAAEREQEKDAD